MKENLLKVFIAFAFLTLSLSCGKVEKKVIMEPSLGKVCFKVEPESAEVYVDGNYVGRANEFLESKGCLELSLGRHKVELRKSGFGTYEEIIYVGEAVQWVSARLSPLGGEKKSEPPQKEKSKEKK